MSFMFSVIVLLIFLLLPNGAIGDFILVLINDAETDSRFSGQKIINKKNTEKIVVMEKKVIAQILRKYFVNTPNVYIRIYDTEKNNLENLPPKVTCKK